MLIRAAFCLAMAACPVLADSPTTQSSRSAADVVAEMRAIERRVESDLSKSGNYAALKAQKAELGTQLENCNDKDRPDLAAQKFAVTQQISAMEKAELVKDGQYPALKNEYDRLTLEAASRPKDTQLASAPDRPTDQAPVASGVGPRRGYARLRIGAHKSSLIGVQTFTFQQ